MEYARSEDVVLQLSVIRETMGAQRALNTVGLMLLRRRRVKFA